MEVKTWNDNLDFYVEWFSEHQSVYDNYVDYVKNKNITSILEIGCGTGRLFQTLRERGYSGDYLGVDITKGFIDYCKKELGESFFLCGDAKTVDFDRDFDLCAICQVLRHNQIVDRDRILLNTAPHVGGYLLAEPIDMLYLRETSFWLPSPRNLYKGRLIDLSCWDGTVSPHRIRNLLDQIRPIKSINYSIPRSGVGCEEIKGVAFGHSYIEIIFKGAHHEEEEVQAEPEEGEMD